MKKNPAPYYSTKIDIGNLQLNVVLPGFFFDGKIEKECEMHAHSGFELHYVYSGKVEIETDNEAFTLENNIIYLIPPFKYHIVKNSSDDLKQLTFVFNLKENKSCDSKSGMYAKYQKIFSGCDFIRTVKTDAVYFNDLFECITMFNRDSELDREIIRSFFLLIFKKVADGISTEDSQQKIRDKSKTPGKISEVIRAKQIDDYMFDNYKSDVSIESLAEYLHLSVRQTGRFLKNYVGVNFNDYIRKYRVEHAKNLLAKSDIPPEKIAFEVGYKSYNGFSEAFRKVVGMRPKQYAEMCRKKSE